jgi:hypothetical protein
VPKVFTPQSSSGTLNSLRNEAADFLGVFAGNCSAKTLARSDGVAAVALFRRNAQPERGRPARSAQGKGERDARAPGAVALFRQTVASVAETTRRAVTLSLISLRFPKSVRFVNSAAMGRPVERPAGTSRSAAAAHLRAVRVGNVRRAESSWRRWCGCAARLQREGSDP